MSTLPSDFSFEAPEPAVVLTPAPKPKPEGKDTRWGRKGMPNPNKDWVGPPTACPECNVVFRPKLPKHTYCTQTCYNRAVARKKKKDKCEGKPWYRCGECGLTSRFTYAPTIEWERHAWEKCPGCQSELVNKTERYRVYMEHGSGVRAISWEGGLVPLTTKNNIIDLIRAELPLPPKLSRDWGREY